MPDANTITFTTARPHHAEQMSKLICLGFEVPDDYCNEENDIAPPASLRTLMQRFPEGQFIALEGEKVVGFAITLLVKKSPYEGDPLRWKQVLGDFSAKNHDPAGEWLYGYEFVVHPAYRKHGIGTRLYDIRFEFIKERNLRGYYAGGMLMGYHRYSHQLSPREYGEKVMTGELTDPTVTMQIKRGFRPLQVIENYLEGEPRSGNAAILIVWENLTYSR